MTKNNYNQEQYLIAILETTADGFWVVGTDGSIIDVNEAYCQISGYSREELLKMHVYDIDALEIESQTLERIEQIIRNGSEIFETRHRRKDGVIFDVEMSVTFLNVDTGKFVCFGRDITERKLAEEELRESNTRLKSFLHISQRINSSLEQDELMQSIVDNATRAIGIDSCAVYLLKDNDQIHLAATTPSLPDNFPDEFRLASLNEHPHIREAIESERYVFMPDSKIATLTAAEQDIVQMINLRSILYIPILLRGHSIGVLILSSSEKKYTFTEEEIFLLQGFANQAAQVFANARNYNQTLNYTKELEQEITCRKQAEKALSKAKNEAEAANQSKSEFLAIMSHELRTPLNAVIGFNEILLNTKLNEEQKHYAEIIHKSGKTLLDIIEDILDFSKIESCRLELDILDFDLLGLLDVFLETMTMRAHDKGLKLLYKIEPDVPAMMCGDPGRLLQILTNLAGNAIKFTSHGEVAIHISVASCKGENVLLHFSVKDTGIGIPEDKIKLIFEKFAQVDASNTRRFGGAGLGLAISKQLVEMIGGNIGVISKIEKGSEFWFTARMKKQSESEPIEKKGQTFLHKEYKMNLHILLVEDDIFNQEVAREMLVGLGFNVDVVSNGQEAVKALEISPYDLVLMDVQMPEMDGVEATRIIRNKNSAVLNHKIPIIAMTAHAVEGDRERLLETGMDDYVSKPVTLNRLRELMNKWNEIVLVNR